MNKNIVKLLLGAALMLGVTACIQKEEVPKTEGTLNLKSLSVVNDDAAKIITFENSRDGVDVTDYIIEIYNGTATTPVKAWSFAAMPEIVTLTPGDYRVDVQSHKVKDAEWDKPYFKGSQSFKVVSGQITDIGEVLCRFASVRVSVAFSDELKELASPDTKVTVTGAAALNFGLDETRSGYFAVPEGQSTMIIEFNGTLSGVPTKYRTIFTDVEPGQHRKLSFTTKKNPDIPADGGTINPAGIQLDASMVTETLDGGVIIEESIIKNPTRPWGDGGSVVTPPTPTLPAATFEAIDNPNFNLDGVNTASDSFGNAIVRIHCSEGVKALEVTIESTSDNFMMALADFGLDRPFDLAKPGALKDALSGLGLPVEEQVVGQTTVDFNITNFIGMIALYPGDHKFTLKVVDSKGAEAPLVLRFKAL